MGLRDGMNYIKVKGKINLFIKETVNQIKRLTKKDSHYLYSLYVNNDDNGNKWKRHTLKFRTTGIIQFDVWYVIKRFLKRLIKKDTTLDGICLYEITADEYNMSFDELKERYDYVK